MTIIEYYVVYELDYSLSDSRAFLKKVEFYGYINHFDTKEKALESLKEEGDINKEYTILALYDFKID